MINGSFLLLITVDFLSAATAAESQSASVRPAAARPPHRHTTAAYSIHHLTANTGPTE